MLKGIQLKIHALMKYIADWKSKRLINSTRQWGCQETVMLNHQEEMRKVGEEMCENRAINEFENELIEYIQSEIPQWVDFENREPLALREEQNNDTHNVGTIVRFNNK